jgi:hypothetical protein
MADYACAIPRLSRSKRRPVSVSIIAEMVVLLRKRLLAEVGERSSIAT